MFYKKCRAARYKFLKESGLTIDPEEIVEGKVRIFGFRIIDATFAREREVWALLRPDPVEQTANDTIKSAKVLDPCPKPKQVYELGKKLGVEVWHLAIESRPIIK